MEWRKFWKIKLKDCIQTVLSWHPLVVLMAMVGILLFIAINDYLLIGGQIIQCPQFSKTETVSFFFGRSLAEFLMLGLGILLGYKIGEDRGFVENNRVKK